MGVILVGEALDVQQFRSVEEGSQPLLRHVHFPRIDKTQQRRHVRVRNIA